MARSQAKSSGERSLYVLIQPANRTQLHRIRGRAKLHPAFTGRDVWVKKVQYMPMVRGLRKLAMNSGQIKRLGAYVVHKNDEFDYQLGFEADIHHKPWPQPPGMGTCG